MKLLSIALLLISTHCVLSESDAYKFYPRVLVKAVETNDVITNPALLVSKWLFDLELQHLVQEVVQVRRDSHGRILFEMRTPVQAFDIVDKWKKANEEGKASQYTAEQTNTDFLDEFPTDN